MSVWLQSQRPQVVITCDDPDEYATALPYLQDLVDDYNDAHPDDRHKVQLATDPMIHTIYIRRRPYATP